MTDHRQGVRAPRESGGEQSSVGRGPWDGIIGWREGWLYLPSTLPSSKKYWGAYRKIRYTIRLSKQKIKNSIEGEMRFKNLRLIGMLRLNMKLIAELPGSCGKKGNLISYMITWFKYKMK